MDLPLITTRDSERGVLAFGPLSTLVLPRSRAQCLMWWASVQEGGRSQVGNKHAPSRAARATFAPLPSP